MARQGPRCAEQRQRGQRTEVREGAGVQEALTEICERWDGKGAPRGTEGEALLLPMRIVNVAHIAEIVHHRAGRASAIQVVKRRAGGQFDPAIAETFAREAEPLFDAIELPSIWESFLDAEPAPHATASTARPASAPASVGRPGAASSHPSARLPRCLRRQVDAASRSFASAGRIARGQSRSGAATRQAPEPEPHPVGGAHQARVPR